MEAGWNHENSGKLSKPQRKNRLRFWRDLLTRTIIMLINDISKSGGFAVSILIQPPLATLANSRPHRHRQGWQTGHGKARSGSEPTTFSP